MAKEYYDYSCNCAGYAFGTRKQEDDLLSVQMCDNAWRKARERRTNQDVDCSFKEYADALAELLAPVVCERFNAHIVSAKDRLTDGCVWMKTHWDGLFVDFHFIKYVEDAHESYFEYKYRTTVPDIMLVEEALAPSWADGRYISETVYFRKN